MKTLLVYSNVDGFAIQLKNHVEEAFDELQIEWKECYIADVEKAVKDFQPTMTMFFHPNKMIYDYLPVIKEIQGHKLLWGMEDPWESDITFDMLPYFYYIFTHEESVIEPLRRESNGNKIFHVPHACNPRVHKPMDVPYEYRSDILFVGNAYDSRLKWLQEHAEEYRDKMVTLIGVGYRGLDGYQNQRVIHGHISEPEMIKYINGAKLVLNLHRQHEDLKMANSRNIHPQSHNNRYYEVYACGKEQLVIGRGDEQIDAFPPEYWHREHSYKKRLVDFYLPLLK